MAGSRSLKEEVRDVSCAEVKADLDYLEVSPQTKNPGENADKPKPGGSNAGGGSNFKGAPNSTRAKSK